MSQESQILAHLRRATINPMQALERYGCFRLAARIADLRSAGHTIETTMVDRDGKRFAKYRLVA